MLQQTELNDLIIRVKKGDKDAFRELVENHQQFAFNLAFRVLCNEEDARDSVQESFIKIWQKINTYEPAQKFTTWMYKIVTNTSIDRLRNIRRKAETNLAEVNDHVILLTNAHQSSFETKELGQLIHALANHLPEKQRLVFVLRDIQGMSSQEVEEILDQPTDTVKSNLYHARKTIREKLKKIIKYERREK